MAYIPTEWETGDVITAEKLNKAEQGIAAANAKGGVFMISETNVEEVHTLGKTWQEISDEYESGNLCVIRGVYGNLFANKFVNYVDYVDNDGVRTYRIITPEDNYLCDATDAYPVYNGSET